MYLFELCDFDGFVFNCLSFRSIPEENRKRHLCDLRATGNQIHFLLYCPFYHNIGYKLFLKLSAECPKLFSMSDECRPEFLFTDIVSSVCV